MGGCQLRYWACGMLTKKWVSVACAVTLFGIAVPAGAAECDPSNYWCSAEIGGGGRSGGGERVCRAGERVVSCSGAFGDWIDAFQMWCAPKVPQPARSDPVWESHTDGVIHVCRRPQGAGVADSGWTVDLWLPKGAEQSVPDPKDLAQRKVSL